MSGLYVSVCVCICFFGDLDLGVQAFGPGSREKISRRIQMTRRAGVPMEVSHAQSSSGAVGLGWPYRPRLFVIEGCFRSTFLIFPQLRLTSKQFSGRTHRSIVWYK